MTPDEIDRIVIAFEEIIKRHAEEAEHKARIKEIFRKSDRNMNLIFWGVMLTVLVLIALCLMTIVLGG